MSQIKKTKTIRLLSPSEDSNFFTKEQLFEAAFVTPREQRMMIETLIHLDKDVEVITLNEYVVSCILVNCIDNQDVTLRVFKEGLADEDSVREWIEVVVDDLMYFRDREMYRGISDIVDQLSAVRLKLMNY